MRRFPKTSIDPSFLCITPRDISHFTGDGIGDRCVKDFDGDGVPNHLDACPVDKFVTRTDFTKMQFVKVNPYQKPANNPIWLVDRKVSFYARAAEAVSVHI